MRVPLIAGNWKMHGTLREAADLAGGILKQLEGLEGVEVVVCPPFPYLFRVREVLDGSKVALGAQDCHWDEKGAYTGEVSPMMLKETGCRYVLLGHSERRHIIGESNDQIGRKVKATLAHGLTPILCVGELLEERSMGVTYEVIDRQLSKGLGGLPAAEAAGLVLAYEPVWAIGTGKTATPRQASEVHRYVRKELSKMFGEATARNIRILYGGSVKPDNIKDLMAEEDIDGALVGGASLDPATFAAIVRSAAR
jgi:triosephosphate isomerase